MQSTHKSSKGKGRAADGDYEDYAQSFASLSLSDYGDHAPRSGSYGSPYTDVYGSTYEQPYTADNYSWTAQSPLPPTQSSSALYGGTPGYSSIPAYGNSYSTTSATSSTGGYGYQNGSSGTSNYSGYADGYDTASVTGNSVTSSSAPSSYGGASVSGQSETYSYRTGASSVPSTHSNRTDVNNTINRQGPPTERYQLPCEFQTLTRCNRVFPGDDEQGWMDHVEEHLQGKFPTKLRCWFCNDQYFDARETSQGDTRSNFNMRMHHIRHHIVYDGYRPEQMQKDGHLVQHLLDRNIIDRRTYESIVNLTTVPPVPGSQDRRRGNNSSRRLPQVEEEVAAEPSRRQHHGSERRREHHHGSSSHRRRH